MYEGSSQREAHTERARRTACEECVMSEEESLYDKESDEAGGCVVQSAKALRICRDLQTPQPSTQATELFLKRQLDTITSIESMGFKQRVGSSVAHRTTKSVFTSGPKGRRNNTTKFSEHVHNLKNKQVSLPQPPYISPRPCERSGQTAHSMIACTLRDNANHVAIVNKRKPTEAAAQQTTRVHTGSVAVSDVAYRMTTAIVVGLGTSMAKQANQDTTVRVCNTHCSYAYDGNDILSDANKASVFLYVSRTNHFCEDAPTSVCKRDFLQLSTTLAKKELDYNFISSRISQSTNHLQLTCQKIVNAKDGTRIWFSWALLLYLVGDTRAHPLLDAEGFNDFDVAIADAMSAYGHLQVGNRSRRQAEDFANHIKSVAESESSDPSSCKRQQELAKLLEILKNMTDNWNSTHSASKAVAPLPSEDDEDEDDEESIDSGFSLERMSTALHVKRNDCLSRKLRRNSYKVNSSEPRHAHEKKRKFTGAFGIEKLEFWHVHFAQSACGMAYMNTSCSESVNKLMISNCSLKHLVSESEDASTRAATNVLHWQMDNIQPSEELCNVAKESSLYTRSKILNLLKQDETRSNMVSTWLLRNSPLQDDVQRCVGVGIPLFNADKQTNPRHALIMCCVSPCALMCNWVAPADHHHSRIVWVRNSLRSKNVDESSCVVSEAAEAVAYAWKLNNNKYTSADTRLKLAASRRVCNVSDDAQPPELNGITRSILTFEARILCNKNTLAAAHEVKTKVLDVLATAKNMSTSSIPTHRACQQVSNTTVGFDDTKTPCTTPSNPFGVGMVLSESARFALSQMHARQSPLIAMIAPISPLQESNQCLVNPSRRPWALLHPLDIAFEHCSSSSAQSVYASDHTALDELPVVSTIVVCGESAVPVTSVLKMLVAKMRDKSGFDAQQSMLKQYRAMLFMAGVQCNTLNCFSNAVSARDMNTSVDGTSKIYNPDNHRQGFLTPFQAYVVGHSNVPEMFAGTSWRGAYGACYDCGSVACVGNNGKHVLSDKRLPIKHIMMDQKQVDELCVELAAHTVVPVSASEFEAVPSETAGLPRYLIPGLHTALKDLCRAFNTVRYMTGKAESDTVMSIQVLPFSPFTEAVPPVVNQGTWKGFRDNKRPNGGWAMHRCDSTLREASILGNDLFAQARPKMTQPEDNVFETIDAYSSSVFVMAVQVGCIAQALHAIELGMDDYEDIHAAMRTLKRVCSCIHQKENSLPQTHAVLGFDALVLLNACAPVSFDVGKEVILAAYQHGPSLSMQKACTSIHQICELEKKITSTDVSDAVHYWDRMQSGIWEETTALVYMLHRNACTFKNTFDVLKASANVFEEWVRSLWKLHSNDGKSSPEEWSPFYECRSPQEVQSGHINCVFIDREDNPNRTRRKQRGAAFGLANNAPNQLLSLLTSSFLSGVVVNHARNEGNICLRHSCSALKRGEQGEKPSLKSTSPVNSENDWESFGTFETKQAQAMRQQEAWTKNNRLLFNATKHMMFDKNYSGKARGSVENFNIISKMCASRQVSGIVSAEQKYAEAEVALASTF